MFDRAWPEDRARAWLLATTAGFLKDGVLEDEAQELARHALSISAGWQREDGFRRLLADALSWTEKEIDRAVAEVYGEAPVEAATCNDCGERATLRRRDFGTFCGDCAPAIDGLVELPSAEPTPPRPAADVGLLIERLKRERDEARAAMTAIADALSVVPATTEVVLEEVRRRATVCGMRQHQEAAAHAALAGAGIPRTGGGDGAATLGLRERVEMLVDKLPASARGVHPVLERVGQLVYAIRQEMMPGAPASFELLPEKLREVYRRIAASVFAEAEQRIGKSLQQAGRDLVQSGDHGDLERGAALRAIRRLKRRNAASSRERG